MDQEGGGCKEHDGAEAVCKLRLWGGGTWGKEAGPGKAVGQKGVRVGRTQACGQALGRGVLWGGKARRSLPESIHSLPLTSRRPAKSKESGLVLARASAMDRRKV